MLTDENDCSIQDDGVGWLVATAGVAMPKATAVCDTNPNDPCCRSCAQVESKPPTGCVALSADPVCETVAPGQSYASWDTLHDALNLRCYDQRQRFGFDLLYDTARYVWSDQQHARAAVRRQDRRHESALRHRGEQYDSPRSSGVLGRHRRCTLARYRGSGVFDGFGAELFDRAADGCAGPVDNPVG